MTYDLHKDGAGSYELAMAALAERWRRGECFKTERGCMFCGGECRVKAKGTENGRT